VLFLFFIVFLVDFFFSFFEAFIASTLAGFYQSRALVSAVTWAGAEASWDSAYAAAESSPRSLDARAVGIGCVRWAAIGVEVDVLAGLVGFLAQRVLADEPGAHGTIVARSVVVQAVAVVFASGVL
jgi:hypothetical protein